MTRSSTLLLPIIDAPAANALTHWDDPQDWHLFETDSGSSLYVADGSRIFALDEAAAEAFRTVSCEPEAQNDLLAEMGIRRLNAITDEPVRKPPLRSLSLAVAQKCNLGCTYCYAEGGDFGGPARNMTNEVALQSVDRLFMEASPGEKVHLTFLGGEPLVNREVLRNATVAAVKQGARKNVDVGFSITTNGTLLCESDADFFEQYGFAVTVSLDGIGAIHDALRPFKGGSGTYHRIIDRVTPMLARQHAMQVSARITVTPRNLRLRETLDELVGLGFHSVGFSPMLSSPTGRDQMGGAEFDVLLEQMTDCGNEFIHRLTAGNRYPFSNMVTAMNEIHRGTHRPYPCGAGSGYFGVSADGDLFACHRFVDDPAGMMGSLESGVDQTRQSTWLSERHVHFQSPCNSCWAKYLCGGGCHHEVIRRGRPACLYIRGWLHYCLQAYVRLHESVPGYFEQLSTPCNRDSHDVSGRP